MIWEADLRYPSLRRDRLWFRAPVASRPMMTKLADPFVLGCFQQVFRVAGKLPSCFPSDVDDETIRRLRIPPISLRFTYLPLLEVLRERGIRGTWVTTLEEAVARNAASPGASPADHLPNWLRLWIRMLRQQTGLRRSYF